MRIFFTVMALIFCTNSYAQPQQYFCPDKISCPDNDSSHCQYNPAYPWKLTDKYKGAGDYYFVGASYEDGYISSVSITKCTYLKSGEATLTNLVESSIYLKPYSEGKNSWIKSHCVSMLKHPEHCPFTELNSR